MLIEYGSFMYCVYVLLPLLLCIACYILLKNRSTALKKGVVLTLSFLNVMQHLLKTVLYPQYAGTQSIYLSTAYNVCALLILSSPFIIAFGNKTLKTYITCVGSFAGMIAMLVPYWFIGESAFSWEAYRFYICHGLLFMSSFLAGLLGLHTFERKQCPTIGLLFLCGLSLILLNDAVYLVCKNYPNVTFQKIFEGLSDINPCWSMHPMEGMDWVVDIIAFFSPSFLMGNNAWGEYIPVLWYALPMYLGITLLAYAVYALTCLFIPRQEKSLLFRKLNEKFLLKSIRKNRNRQKA